MSEKTILILAASRYQVPVIEQAKRLGLRVITTDNVPENPGHRLADRSYSIDTTDREAVLSICHKENVNGIIAACTDVAVPTAAHVSSRLGLPGLPLESAEICCDKIAFRQFLRERCYPVPRIYPYTASMHPPEEIFKERWIIKPAQASGSKGIFIVSSYKEFLKRSTESLFFSPTGKGICESFIEGLQGTCEGIVHCGKVIWPLITDRRTAEPPYATTFGHRVPGCLAPKKQDQLISMIEGIFRHLHVSDCVFDCDFVSSANDIYILEITPRLGGNSLCSLVKLSTGFNIIKYALCQACNIPQPLPVMPGVIPPTELLLLGVMRAGTIQYNEDELLLLKQEPYVKELMLDCPPDTKVLPFINGRHRLGQAIICASSASELQNRITELKRRLSLRVS